MLQLIRLSSFIIRFVVVFVSLVSYVSILLHFFISRNIKTSCRLENTKCQEQTENNSIVSKDFRFFLPYQIYWHILKQWTTLKKSHMWSAGSSVSLYFFNFEINHLKWKLALFLAFSEFRCNDFRRNVMGSTMNCADVVKMMWKEEKNEKSFYMTMPMRNAKQQWHENLSTLTLRHIYKYFITLIWFFDSLFSVNEMKNFRADEKHFGGKDLKSLWAESLKIRYLKAVKPLCSVRDFSVSLGSTRRKTFLSRFYYLDRRAFSASKTINPFVKLKILAKEKSKAEILKQHWVSRCFSDWKHFGEWKNFFYGRTVFLLLSLGNSNASTRDATESTRNIPLTRLYYFLSSLILIEIAFSFSWKFFCLNFLLNLPSLHWQHYLPPRHKDAIEA